MNNQKAREIIKSAIMAAIAEYPSNRKQYKQALHCLFKENEKLKEDLEELDKSERHWFDKAQERVSECKWRTETMVKLKGENEALHQDYDLILKEYQRLKGEK